MSKLLVFEAAETFDGRPKVKFFGGRGWRRMLNISQQSVPFDDLRGDHGKQIL